MTIRTTSYSPKAAEVQPGWRVIDATDRPLGRVASEIACVLRGKHKPIYAPHADTGDYVIVVNASKVRVSGSKTQRKMYYSHSMYPGGFKAVPFEQLLARRPERIIESAVWGMLPKNRLGRALLRRLKVYAGAAHPHGAQVKEYAAPEKPGRPRKKPARKPHARKVAEPPTVPTPAAPDAAPGASRPGPGREGQGDGAR